MNIGDAARASGVSVKMIRHYEAIGLLARAKRSYSGYRVYDEADLPVLRFIRRARDAGFSIPRIRQPVFLWDDRERPSGEVRALALAHRAEVEARIAELKAIADTLTHLIERCQGDDRPECPILDSLAGADAAGETPAYAKTQGRRSPTPRRLRHE